MHTRHQYEPTHTVSPHTLTDASQDRDFTEFQVFHLGISPESGSTTPLEAHTHTELPELCQSFIAYLLGAHTHTGLCWPITAE
jgi:hypothetical protein